AEPEVDVAAFAVLLLEIPFAWIAPAEAGRTDRADDFTGVFVQRYRLPVRIVGLAKAIREVCCAQKPVGDEPPVALDPRHEKRKIGVAPGIIEEIRHLPLDIEFAQDDVSERQRERRIGALLWMQPQIGELAGLAVVR